MTEGAVLWYNKHLGYGMAVTLTGSEVFIHYSSLNNAKYLNKGDKVEFDVYESTFRPDSLEARNVIKL